MTEETTNKLSNHYSLRKLIELCVIVLVTVVVWNLPITCFGINGLTVVQQRIIAIFAFATLA